jgi:hypothetical protein
VEQHNTRESVSQGFTVRVCVYVYIYIWLRPSQLIFSTKLYIVVFFNLLLINFFLCLVYQLLYLHTKETIYTLEKIWYGKQLKWEKFQMSS